MNTALTSFQNHLPRRVITGRGESQRLTELCRFYGWRRVFVVSDSGVAAAGLLASVTEPLANADLLAGVFSAVPPEPPISVVDSIATSILESKADVIVALGGGSVMDATKVASIGASQDRKAQELIGIGKVVKRGLPTILIPTTAGTGSEATFVAILTDTTNGNKVGVVDPALLADIAMVDPALTDNLPPLITAAAGMDAIVHAIEAFIAKVATPIARGLALEAAKHLGGSILPACQEPGNLTARDGMAIGSHLAGMAFANSSCCAVHALALPLGGRFHIPHGVITGCLAGEMMRHNAPVCREKFLELAIALGWGNLENDSFCDRLDHLADSIGLRSHLHKTKVPAQTFESMARDAVAIRRLVDPNPRDVSESDAARIYRAVLSQS